MKKIKLFAVLTAMAVLSFGLMSCGDVNGEVNGEDVEKEETGKQEETGPSLPEPVGEDPFAGKTVTIGNMNLNDVSSDPDRNCMIFKFGTDKSATLESWRLDDRSWEYKKDYSFGTEYSYDTSKKEVYFKTKTYILGETSYTAAKANDLKTALVQKDIDNLSGADEFKSDDDEAAYREMMGINEERAVKAIFGELTTMGYEIDGEKITISFEDDYEASYRGYDAEKDVNIYFNSFNFEYGSYTALTVKWDKEKKTIEASDVFYLYSESGEGEIIHCKKVEGKFVVSTYTIEKETNLNDEEYDEYKFTFTSRPAEIENSGNTGNYICVYDSEGVLVGAMTLEELYEAYPKTEWDYYYYNDNAQYRLWEEGEDHGGELYLERKKSN